MLDNVYDVKKVEGKKRRESGVGYVINKILRYYYCAVFAVCAVLYLPSPLLSRSLMPRSVLFALCSLLRQLTPKGEKRKLP